MIMIQFSFDIQENKIKEFLEYSNSTLKNTWEVKGCKLYTAYRSVDEKIRPDQIIRKNEIIEQLIFNSIDDVKKFFDKTNMKPQELEIEYSYEKKFNAKNLQCRILEKNV